MKENSYDNNMNELDEEKVDYQELLFRYIIHWPWFVVSVLACLIGAWVYLHFQTPVYQVSASIMIKDDKKGGGGGSTSDLENLGIGGMITSTQSIDNEIEVLRSKTILKEVVNNLELYITYYDEDEFPKKELYKTSPIIVNLTAQEADNLPGVAMIDMKLTQEGGLDVNLKVGLNEYNKHFDKLPAVLPTDVGTFGFALKDSLSNGKIEGQNVTRNISAIVSQPFGVAKGYQWALSIVPTSKATSVAVVSLMNTNIQRAQDFINKLMEMYNRNTNNDKNEVAEKTREFINERIQIIDEELGSTEDKLEAFKRNAGLTDISSDAQLAVSGNAEYEKKRVENGTQINLVRDLAKYINNPSNEYEVLPSNIGLTDNGLATQLERYNELVIERKRLLRTSTESNPMIVNLDTSIRAMKSNVQAAINGTLQGLLIVKADLDREASRFSRRISDAPGQERQYVSIARQQEIKAGLYLMLLQKREENELSQAFTAYNTRIITKPGGSMIPTAPVKKNILLVAFALGMLIPVVIIFMKENMNTVVRGRKDLENLTIPFVGEIPLDFRKKKKFSRQTQEKECAVVVKEKSRNVINEAFRVVRTNLEFMQNKGSESHVIMITSANPGSGKTFISFNLATSLGIKGKRIIAIDLDLRKASLSQYAGRPKKGISDYLAGDVKDIKDVIVKPSGDAKIDLIPVGTVPPNPTELLFSERPEQLITDLRAEYDYIFIDCPPVEIVADAAIINKLVDMTLFIVRAGLRDRSMLPEIEKFYADKTYKNMSVILNGTDGGSGRYGYKYGYKYG